MSEQLRDQGGGIGTLPEPVRLAIQAAHNRKAFDVTVLDLRRSAAFTDYFIVCSGQTSRQVRAIVDAVSEALRRARVRPAHLEGYERGEWVLVDCFDFMVHVFTPSTRAFYGLERLWGSADRLELDEEERGSARSTER